jgi:hypothetical protein
VAGVAALCAQAHAQSQNTSGDETKLVNLSRPKQPVQQVNEVPTTDPVVLLGVQRTAATSGEGAVPGKPAEVAPLVPAGGDVIIEDTKKKAAEIASLEEQIQDKMKRIALLMRLFVNDEKSFIVDPAHPQTDKSAQDRRKYEQDELLWETAELAKLKARLNAKTAVR